MRRFSFIFLGFIFILYSCGNNSSGNENNKTPDGQDREDLQVIAYWTGSDSISNKKIQQLDQIIYSFLHLEENRLKVNERDSLRLIYLKEQKQIYPDFKVLVALGGWGGCETCSEVFSTEKGREDFAISVRKTLEEYDLDGIDLDWEYPAISGYEGHTYKPEDKRNFTLLIEELRSNPGPDYIISFAAGGFRKFLDNSIEWKKVMPLVDHVNLMSYDMVGGGSTSTGHHTSLLSTKDQTRSAEEAIKYLDSLGVPSEKIVLGAAFYARIFENVQDSLNGLHQTGKFKEAILYKDIDAYIKSSPGFKYFWDSEAQAPYIYNAEKGEFITYDDSLSVSKKTKYALENGLKGIMFWQLSGDKPEGLLEVINDEKKKFKN